MDAKSFDKISWLPDEVLGSILSLLPTKQAASTSLLSKRWRFLFSLVDNLDLDDSVSLHAAEDEQARFGFPDSFKEFVDRKLALQRDYPIKKFSLKCHVGKDDQHQKACVGRWISNVVGRGAFELDLRIKDQGIHFMPPQLFANDTLVNLTLGTRLYLGKIPPNVSLPSLKFLFIDSVFFKYRDLCCVLLPACPVLEELSVHHFDFCASPHTISSPTVTRLSVHYDSPLDVDTFSFMSFDLPKLVYLDYSHSALGHYTQVNLESLVEAKLNLYPAQSVERPDVTDLIVGVRNVEILHLSPVSVDVIYAFCRRGLPVFDNLVKLSFGSKKKRGWKLLASLLAQSPKLETLVVQDLNAYTGNVPMPLNKVKALHILGYRGTTEGSKQLESFLGEFKCLELVRVDVAEDDGTRRDLVMLLTASLPSKCHFIVT